MRYFRDSRETISKPYQTIFALAQSLKGNGAGASPGVAMNANDLEEIRTAINKMIAQTEKINREARYYPIIAIAALVTSLCVAFKVLHG
jgi:hypothetical protein